jgi:predicted nucleic acid-binding protein
VDGLSKIDCYRKYIISKRARHVKDIPFLALALQLGCPLWSNDKHFQGLEGVLVYL